LRAFVQRPGRRQGQRMRWDHLSGEKMLANVHVMSSIGGIRTDARDGDRSALR
jgi:hypothetical protein